MSDCVYVVFWECFTEETKAVVALEFPRKILDEQEAIPEFAQERAESDARYCASEIVGPSFTPFRFFDVATYETTNGVRYKVRFV